MEFPNRVDPSPTALEPTTPQSTGTTSLKNELEAGTPKKGDKAQLTDSIDVTEKGIGTSESFSYQTFHHKHRDKDDVFFLKVKLAIEAPSLSISVHSGVSFPVSSLFKL